jgi:hypothetical protein
MATGPGKTPTTLEIQTDLWKRAQKAAIDRDVSKRGMIEDALRLWLRHGDKPPDQVTIPEEHPVMQATPEELEVATAAIALVREGNSTSMEILDTILRKYRGRMVVNKGSNAKKRSLTV